MVMQVVYTYLSIEKKEEQRNHYSSLVPKPLFPFLFGDGRISSLRTRLSS